MRIINDLREICRRYENGDFDLLELQSRLNTVSKPDSNLLRLDELLLNIDNEIEEIIYTQLESSYSKLGLQAIQAFLNKLNNLEENN